MSNHKIIDPNRRKYFTLGDGEDELALIIPFENLDHFYRLIKTLIDGVPTEVPNQTGYYITHIGPFSDYHP